VRARTIFHSFGANALPVDIAQTFYPELSATMGLKSDYTLRASRTFHNLIQVLLIQPYQNPLIYRSNIFRSQEDIHRRSHHHHTVLPRSESQKDAPPSTTHCGRSDPLGRGGGPQAPREVHRENGQSRCEYTPASS
jgi:hypothetical protein